jgi:predicted MFS family arabinose efflux permease
MEIGPVATIMGRKPALWLACLLIYIANIIMMTTSSIGALYAGRLIIGLGNGLLMTFSQLYIQVRITCLTNFKVPS